MESFECIKESVKRRLLPPRLLLSKFRFIDEQSRYSRACLDHDYLPFYYYLGKNICAKSLVEIGFGLGLHASMYFMACPGVETYLAAQEPPEEYYSPRLGKANIKQTYRRPFTVHVGPIYDEKFIDQLKQQKWEMAFVNEKREYDTYLLWLNTLWDVMSDGGLIFMDYTTLHKKAERAYHDFCIIKNRKPYVFPTRYGVGVVIR